MAFIRDIIKDFSGTDEMMQVQRELITTLAGMAQAKADNFELEIQKSLMTAGKGDNFTIPIESITRSQTYVRAYSAENTEQITNSVKEIISSFVKGGDENVINGVAGIIGTLLDVFLGKSSAETGTTKEYYVMTRGLSIIRLDFMAWYQNVSAQSVYQKMERVCCFVGVRSSVDLSKLGFSTFISLFEDQLAETDMTAEQVKEAIRTVREIFDEYSKISSGEDSTPAHVTQGPASSHIKGISPIAT